MRWFFAIIGGSLSFFGVYLLGSMLMLKIWPWSVNFHLPFGQRLINPVMLVLAVVAAVRCFGVMRGKRPSNRV